MRTSSRWLLIVALALASGCFGGKRTRGGGTNVGTGAGSDYDGPWNGGGGGPAAPSH